MGRPLTAAAITKQLAQAHARYREENERGADMAQAGQELARAVENILAGPVCSVPRSEMLAPLHQADRKELLDAHHHLTSLTRRLSGLEKDMLRVVEQRLKDLGPTP